MKKTESRAEVFLMAFYSLSKAEQKAVVARLLEDKAFLEDLVDVAIVEQRKGEPSIPLEQYVKERNVREHKARYKKS